MTMPALQSYRAAHPEVRISMLTRPALAPLWTLHTAVDDTLVLPPSLRGMQQAIRALRTDRPLCAYVFPNSWRAALVPFCARIPHRIGRPGHHRRSLLTESVCLSQRAAIGHQQWEYVDILQLDTITELPPPTLTLPKIAHAAFHEAPRVGILPGAARGPAKQWPETHFIEAAHRIAEAHPGCRFIVFGTAAETPLCNRVATAIGKSAHSRAGQTTLPELAAALAHCHTVLCNDSGGMHLAAATGTPVVAIYGITASDKTGPLGAGHQLICAGDVSHTRDIPRDSHAARKALQSITPDRVARAACQLLETSEKAS